MNLNFTLLGTVLLLIGGLFTLAACSENSGPSDGSARPELTAWFNQSSCDFSKSGNGTHPLSESLERFCQDSPPVTETAMVVQVDRQNAKGVATCDFSDTQACEILADFCDTIGGTGHCEFSRCYCEWELART